MRCIWHRLAHQLTLFTDTEFDLQERLADAEPITLDALYMTRPQRERRDDSTDAGVEYLRVDAATFQDPAMRHTVLMHPLPRTCEISSALDRDPRALYFRQAASGVPIRMALIEMVLAEHAGRGVSALPARSERSAMRIGPRCGNPNCITRREEVQSERRFRFHHEAGGRAHLVCLYCDHDTRIQVIGNRKSKHFHVYEEPMYGYLDAWLRDDALVIFDTVKQAEEAAYKSYKLGPQKSIMTAQEIEQAIAELTDAILHDTRELKELVIVGIRMAGAFIAHRIAERIHVLRGAAVDLGVLDVQGGGDTIPRWPATPGTDAPSVTIADRHVVIVDDVINTGWTVKDALAAVGGRPTARHGSPSWSTARSPAAAARSPHVGKHLPTAPHERVRVRLRELDREHRRPGRDLLLHRSEGARRDRPGDPRRSRARSGTRSGPRCHVLVDGGRIVGVAFDDDPPQARATIDATGLWVTPGLIDMHVHLREPGKSTRRRSRRRRPRSRAALRPSPPWRTPCP